MTAAQRLREQQQAARDFDMVIFLLTLFSAGFVLAGHRYIGAGGFLIVAIFETVMLFQSRRRARQRAAEHGGRF